MAAGWGDFDDLAVVALPGIDALGRLGQLVELVDDELMGHWQRT
jgi:hypothetical protein